MRRWGLVSLLAAVFVLVAGHAALAADFPGVPLGPSPVTGWASATYQRDNVHSIQLNAGDTLAVTLTSEAGSDFDLFLFMPGTLSVSNGNWESHVVARSENAFGPDRVGYVALLPGTYYLDVWAAKGEGNYTLAWSRQPADPNQKPVWRFYNTETGVHFYTADPFEQRMICLQLWETYKYDGIAYNLSIQNPANSMPLYRFYNFRKSVHFYTADPAERDNVIANLGWTYRYEGIAYYVSAAPYSGTPVYRFYNVSAGVHFYTADPAERDNVIANYGRLYRYEGLAYYIGN